MFCFDYHADARRMQCFHERIGYLNSELLLDLQTARKHVHDPCDLGKSNYFPARDVGDVGAPNKWKKMMLTHRVELDVLDQNDLARVGTEDCAVDDFVQILAVAGC